MLNWLKTSWTAFTVALLAAGAIFAVASAQRHKSASRKWQGKATKIEQGNVINGVERAEQASSQAKLHEARAESIKAKAEARITQIGKKDEDVADILDRWRAA